MKTRGTLLRKRRPRLFVSGLKMEKNTLQSFSILIIVYLISFGITLYFVRWTMELYATQIVFRHFYSKARS